MNKKSKAINMDRMKKEIRKKRRSKRTELQQKVVLLSQRGRLLFESVGVLTKTDEIDLGGTEFESAGWNTDPVGGVNTLLSLIEETSSQIRRLLNKRDAIEDDQDVVLPNFMPMFGRD